MPARGRKIIAQAPKENEGNATTTVVFRDPAAATTTTKAVVPNTERGDDTAPATTATTTTTGTTMVTASPETEVGDKTVPACKMGADTTTLTTAAPDIFGGEQHGAEQHGGSDCSRLNPPRQQQHRGEAGREGELEGDRKGTDTGDRGTKDARATSAQGGSSADDARNGRGAEVHWMVAAPTEYVNGRERREGRNR